MLYLLAQVSPVSWCLQLSWRMLPDKNLMLLDLVIPPCYNVLLDKEGLPSAQGRSKARAGKARQSDLLETFL